MSGVLNRVAYYQNRLDMKKRSFKSIVGLVQFSATESVEDNFAKSATYIKECANKGAGLVCLPEHFAYMGKDTNVQETY